MSRKSSTKTRTAPTSQPQATPAVLPVRPVHPDFITEQQIRAAYAARLANLPHTPIRAWQTAPDGTAHLAFPSGNRIHHTPDADTPFTALTPCAAGFTHTTPITDRTQLTNAVNTAAHCTDLHGRTRILTLPQAATTAEDTQALNVTGLRATAVDDQPKEHPEP
ncbi:hypothetical protein ABZ826_23580 [Streptomyces sp. NPDC047515]|uniref:hypothetical protein n=1 Tax=Streptomyces sp. NPDC047515 TaxID=3155380 RepID=UPI0033F64D92